MSRPRTRGEDPLNRRLTIEERGVMEIDGSLLDIVDHVLTKGIVITGDLVLGVADIDLVYLRLSAVLCAADRVLGSSANKRRRTTDARASVAKKMGRPRLTPKR